MAELSSTSLFGDANLVAYYKAEDASDSKGTFTLTNNNSVTFSVAEYNNGANGGTANTNKYLGTTNNLGITGGSITLTGRVKMNTEIGTLEQDFFAQQDVGVSVDYRMAYQYNAGNRRIAFGRYRQSISADEVYGTMAIGTSNFAHLVLTYDGAIRGYINGTLAAGPGTYSGNGTSTTTSYMTILQDGTASVNNYSASAIVDDVGVFNRALTATEILTLYQGEAGGNLDLTSKMW